MQESHSIEIQLYIVEKFEILNLKACYMEAARLLKLVQQCIPFYCQLVCSDLVANKQKCLIS